MSEVEASGLSTDGREGQSMRCRKCGMTMAFGLELVRGGKIHECWRCPCRLEVVKVEEAAELRSEWVREPGRLVVRLACRNAYIFDRSLFLRFVRSVAREIEASPRHLVLNLEGIGLVPDSFLPKLFRIRRFLLRHGKQLKIVHRSPLFRAIFAGLDGEVDQYLVPDEAAGLGALPVEPALEAAAV
jgi:hypothetical protein